MKIILERQKCIGCGSCVAVCSKYWEMGDDGKGHLKDSKTDSKTGNEELEIKDSNYQNLKIGWIFSEENIPAAGLLNSINFNSKVLTHIVLDKDIINLNIIQFIKKLGLSVFVYTINRISDSPINNIGNIVEGIITDKPKIFLN